MDPVFAQLIAVGGPQLVAWMIQTIKDINAKAPEAVTEEQWNELRALVAESYDARKARIAREVTGSGG